MSSSSVSVKSNKMAPSKKSSPAAAAPVAVVESAPATTQVVKAKAVKAEKAAAPSKAVATLPTVETPSAAPVAAEAAESSDVILAGLAEKLKALSTELTTRVREATKSVADAIKATKREAREIKKKKKKNPADMTPEERKTWEARRANNAFLVQRPLTDELCAFMGLKSGEKRSQTEVTKFISGYVKQHSCFDPNFKRRILPNSALAKLLRVTDKEEVTYLNLQSFLKVHFIKPKA